MRSGHRAKFGAIPGGRCGARRSIGFGGYLAVTTPTRRARPLSFRPLYGHDRAGRSRRHQRGFPRAGEDRIPRRRDDIAGPNLETEGMELLGSEIIGLLLSAHVLFTAAALALVLLSGIAADVISYIENLGHHWEARSLAQRPTGARYGTDVGAELENVP